MSLDKQEVQDICEHTALALENGADLYVTSARRYDTIALGLLKKEEKLEEEECQIANFFYFPRLYVNCAIIAMLYTHSIGNQP